MKRGRLQLAIALLFGLCSPVSGFTYELVAWPGSLPPDAVVAGNDGSAPLYICVAASWGGSHPGSLDDQGICHVAWGGQELTFDHGFEVLVGSGQAVWVALTSGLVATPFAAGRDDGGPIHVCRVRTTRGVYPGKLVEGWCYVADHGEERYFTDRYEVLVE